MDHSLSDRLSYKAISAESLIQEDKQYDVVCSLEVIEHVDNPALFLRTLANLVKVRLFMPIDSAVRLLMILLQ